MFREGIIVTPRRGPTRMFAVIERASVCSQSEYLGCPKVQLSGEVIAVKTTNVTKRLHVMHDCLGEHCQLTLKRTKERVEQEDVLVEKVYLHHNDNHKYFFKNYYMLRD